ncbi:MAG: hypothetical protein WDN26_09405 [Chitinophagaceae bacterium]
MSPYNNEGLNKIYNLLFCDDINLYKNENSSPGVYPWKSLFADKIDKPELEKIIFDSSLETRPKILAHNLLIAHGVQSTSKELLGVIIEVGLDNGLDVIAAYKDGTARYINQSGKMIVWDTQTVQSNELIYNLFAAGENVITRIGPWDKERKPPPANGMVRLTFLVSDGFYFGEGPFEVLHKDAMGGPVINAAIELMSFLISQTENK